MKKRVLVKILLIALLFTAAGITAQTDVQNKLRLAQSYAEAGQPDKAEKYYREVLEAQPYNVSVVQSLNELFLSQKEYDKSVTLLESLIEKNPMNVSFYGLLGATWYVKGDTEKAFEVWDQGTEVNPESANSYRIIANFVMQNRAFDKAVEVLQKGKEKSNNSDMFTQDLARLYSATMKYDKAAKEYAGMLENNPNRIQMVKQSIGRYITDKNAAESTIEVFNDYGDRGPVFKEMLEFLYIQNENYDKAFEIAEELDKTQGNNGSVLFAFGNTARQAGNYEYAAKAFRLITERYPESPLTASARIAFTETLEKEKDEVYRSVYPEWRPIIPEDTSGAFLYDPILDAYEDLINKYDNPQIKYAAIYNSGVIYKEKYRNYNAAGEKFDTIIRESPMSPYLVPSYKNLAEIEVKRGNTGKAEEYYGKVINSRRSKREDVNAARYRFAEIAFWNKDFKEASGLLAKVSEDLGGDQANDALMFSLIVNGMKPDSAALGTYAEAQGYIAQNKFVKADSLLKSVSENDNLFMLNKFALFELAKVKIAMGNLPVAIELLKELSGEDSDFVFSDKVLILLAETYYNGIGNKEEALSVYRKLLESYPDSLYLDRSRKMIKKIEDEINRV